MARVLLENVTKKYGEVLAVSDLNIEARDKEFLVLVGPSGCGKSTALRMIAGLEEITSGNLYIGNQVMNEVHPKDRDIAMVFQSYALYPHMTVFDNMAFGLRLRKDLSFLKSPNGNGHSGNRGNGGNLLSNRAAREAAIRKRVEEVAEGIGLKQYLNRKPSQLSGGQRQRVALGRAIVREPQVFLMDEPLSNLDAKMRVSTRAELQKLHRRLGVTTIYVTHDQVEAMTMGDRIAVMKDGLLQQLDTPQALYERPTNMFVAGFIGSPAMNMFTAEVESGEDGLFLKGEGFRIRTPAHIVGRISEYRGKQVVMGVRPEAVHDVRFKRQDDPSTEVAASVDVVEPMGRDVYMYLTAGTTPFVARLDDRTDAAPGQRLKVAFDTARLHLFDPTTQRALL